MKIIHNTYIGFRCPNTLKEKMIAYANDNHIHVSQLIRSAVVKMLKDGVSDSPVEETSTSNNGWIVQGR